MPRRFSELVWLGRCPHDPDRAIGHRDDRHVLLCAEIRSGKGRALLVNNQVLWPGSLIAIDPKGEAALIATARRGPGNAHCDGLGRDFEEYGLPRDLTTVRSLILTGHRGLAKRTDTREFIERSLGNTEVTTYEDSIAVGRGTSVAEGVSEVYTHTNSLATTDTTGHSRTHSDTRSRADGVQEHHSHADTHTDGTSRGGSESHGTTNTRGKRSGRGGGSGSNWNYGTNDGRTADKGYGPHILFPSWEHTSNRGTNFSRNRSRGGNQQESWSNDTSRSQSDNQVHTTNYSENSSQGSIDTHSGGSSRIDTVGTTDGQTDSTSQARMIGTSNAHARGTSHIDARIENQTTTRDQRRHVIPLLGALEAKQYQRSFDEPHREQAAFPGLALIILSGEPPYLYLFFP